MNPSLKYAATGLLGIALVSLTLWPFLDPSGRDGVLLAAGVALPVQSLAFAALRHFRDHAGRFMAAWIGGTFLRMVVLAVVAALVIRSDMDGAVPMLLALAGFFFGLLLLEPIYFRPESTTVEA